jgi:hypothetical protein
MTFEQDKEITPVVFRAERSGPFKGDVTAVFPTDAADINGYQMGCYAHVGQHSACSRQWYWTTRAATPAEYASLKRELESAPYGYRLKVYKRITRAHDDARRETARQYRLEATPDYLKPLVTPKRSVGG